MKPQNIIVHRDGEKIIAELGDFGGARGIVHGNGDTTIMKSTPRYVAPEVLISEINSSLSMEADIYSLGMVILHIVSGQIPFVHIKNDAQLLLAVMQGKQPKRESYLTNLLTDNWWNLIVKCWAKSPSERPSIEMISTDLSNI
ncbi:kinase-like domain-containing protein [Cyathus striatus]|nr:kinase-like domain-containing protein [Cyathus striatus]